LVLLLLHGFHVPFTNNMRYLGLSWHNGIVLMICTTFMWICFSYYLKVSSSLSEFKREKSYLITQEDDNSHNHSNRSNAVHKANTVMYYVLCLQPAAHSHICKLHTYYKNYTII
jgi:hypothetical protein